MTVPKNMDIHARLLYTYVKNPFTLWCYIHAPEEEKDQISEYQQMLFDAGNDHESSVIKDLYPNAIEVDTKDREEAFKKLLKLMKEGAETFHNFPVFWEGLNGNVDILQKVEGKSELGDYHYIVKEIKVAKNIKEHHKVQAWFYNYRHTANQNGHGKAMEIG